MDVKIHIEDISLIPIEFLLFTSDNDPFLSKESVYDLAQIVKTYKLVEIKGCDHETILRKDDEVSSEIKSFLSYLSKSGKKPSKKKTGVRRG
jgi:pimeloyl-ACP methyl ester carboxylesterase